MIRTIKSFLEYNVFGVCSYIGEKLRIPGAVFRLFFIYITFLTFTSPLIIYLILAVLLKIKNYIKGKINPVWDY